MLDRAKEIPNIEWMTPYVIDEFAAGENGSLTVARLRNTSDDSVTSVEIAGAFIAVGHDPQSQLVAGQVELDENGYVATQGRSTLTNLPGVFAAGDLVDHTYRQAITAAGSGCQAALDAEWYLRDTPVPGRERRGGRLSLSRLTPGRMRAGAGGRMRPPGSPRMRGPCLNRCGTGSRSAGRVLPDGARWPIHRPKSWVQVDGPYIPSRWLLTPTPRSAYWGSRMLRQWSGLPIQPLITAHGVEKPEAMFSPAADQL